MTPHNETQDKQNSLAPDLALVAFLIGFDVIARILPHAPSVSPVAASALFAAIVLRRRTLALLVPLAAMPLGDLMLGFYDWRVMAVVYAALALPVPIGMLARRYRLSRALLPSMLACSLTFFVTTNFAVWAFSSIYSADMAGVVQCYIAGLPFLKYTVAGDLFWAAVLFGGAFVVHRLSARATSRA
jgi:hypothetical protein